MTATAPGREVIVTDTPEAAAARAAQLVRTLAATAVRDRGRFTLALSGGTTPRLVYDELGRSALSDEMPWGQAEIFFGDERDVSQDHVESNCRMAHRCLLDHVPLAPVQIHPMRGDADDLPAAAAEYERTIRQLVPAEGDGPPRFDLILLGMGADGHVASLYPGTPAAAEDQKLVTACSVDVLGRWRVTFTFPLINAARNVLLLVTGKDKAPAVACLVGDCDCAGGFRGDLPAARVRPERGKLFVILDAAAGRQAGLRPE